MREKFASRLGFILVSAGCAIGLGNVWKFPYMCGENGGALFILIYLFFLFFMGLPIMVMEFSVGRASQKSSAQAFRFLEPAGTRWHLAGYVFLFANQLMMAFYTTVCGWMLYYTYKSMRGDFAGTEISVDSITSDFSQMLESPGTMIFWMVLTVVLALGVCFFGVRKGVERISKIIMSLLLLLIVVLAVNSILLPGAGRGLEFYFLPNWDALFERGFFSVAFAALSQAFFTLSIGMGSMAIFGSYLGKSRSVTGESAFIVALDTFVAIMSGLIIIPACFSFRIAPDAGPSLIFITLPKIFNQMAYGHLWGICFFVFLSFAALTTVIAVFENIISMIMDSFNFSRTKAVFINLFIIPMISLPCIFGFNFLSGAQPLGPGTSILDFEDFLISNNILPLGSIVFLLFCTGGNAWGFRNFLAESDLGSGLKFPRIFNFYYCRYLLPAGIVVIYLKGYWDKFYPLGASYYIPWFCVAVGILALIALLASIRGKLCRGNDKK
ncbi:MAG: sodium-dependent transporter [Opitutales bacterium]|nr:sodium-dependent transporter [Opitutales bacterium]